MTTELERTLSRIQAQIHRTRIALVPDEERFLDHVDCVRSQLVVPILEALGWNSADGKNVRFDYMLDGQDRDSGLAVFVSGAPCFLMELRGLGEHYHDQATIKHLLPKAQRAGFRFLISTDGDCYDAYDAHTGMSAGHRAFDSVRLSVDPLTDAVEFFGLFSRQLLEENRVETQWRCRLVDRQVEDSLQALLVSDSPLVQLLEKVTEGLSAADIRCSMSRLRAKIGFEYHDPASEDSEVEAEHRSQCSSDLSETELLVATWLQSRSIERWARGIPTFSRDRTSQRRVLEKRRTCDDRRSGVDDRRVARVARAEERRSMSDRRSNERRRGGDRRVNGERRRARRQA